MLGKSRSAWNTLESLPDLWLWLNGRRMRDRKENDHLSLFFSSSEPFGTWVGLWLAGLPRVIELWIPSPNFFIPPSLHKSDLSVAITLSQRTLWEKALWIMFVSKYHITCF